MLRPRFLAAYPVLAGLGLAPLHAEPSIEALSSPTSTPTAATRPATQPTDIEEPIQATERAIQEAVGTAGNHADQNTAATQPSRTIVIDQVAIDEPTRRLLESVPADELPPQLRGRLLEAQSDAVPPPASASPPTAATRPTEALLDDVAQRDRAEEIIEKLLNTEDADEIEQLDRELATLHEQAAVALRLATLTGDFQQRQRADAAAARLRWRQAAGPELLAKHDALVATMARGNNTERGALVDAIAESVDSHALGFFVECLTDSQPYVQRRAVDALVALARNDPNHFAAVVSQFNTMLKQGDSNTQVLIVGALSKMQATDIESLAKLLDDPAEELRRTAIHALGYSGNTTAIPHLLPMLKDEQWQIRAATLDALEDLVGRGDDTTTVGPAVTELLADEDAFIRKRAIALLGDISYQAAVPRLHEMIEDGKTDPKILLEALVAMQDQRAKPMIVSRFNAAETSAEKQEWLTLLSQLRNDTEIDALIWDILRDENQESLWAGAIDALDYRSKLSTDLPLVANLMLHEDEAIAGAAYSALRYERDARLPDDAIDKLASFGLPVRRQWALNLLYGSSDPRLTDHLRVALTDTDPQVVQLALAMISSDAGETMPGISLPYRSTSSSSSMVVADGIPIQPDGDTETATPTPASWVADVRKLLTGDDVVAVPAAALLYHSGEGQDDAVKDVVRRGLKLENEPALSGVALWAITIKPEPFEADIDLIALTEQPATRHSAIQIMAAYEDDKYLPHLKKLAKDATIEDISLMRALVVSDDEEALAEAMRIYSETNNRWEANEVIEALMHAPGPGPVKFAAKVLAQANDENRPYELPEMILSLPDPSVAPLLTKLQNHPSYWVEGSTVIARLQQIDPEAAAEVALQMLFSDEYGEIDRALDVLVTSKPTEKTQALALRSMKQQTDVASNVDWQTLTDWLPREYLFESVLPELESLNPSAAEATLASLASDVSAEDVPALLAAQWSTVQTRERLVQVLAVVTTHHPESRPDLATLEPDALAMTISAAAEWPDALDVIDAYLDHAEPKVSQAAAFSLALHTATLEDITFTDRQRDALLAAAVADEPRVAYTAVEALAQHQPGALGTIDADAINGPTARLRAALAGVEVDPQVSLNRLVSGIHGQTPIRLALLHAALRGDSPSSQLSEAGVYYRHGEVLRHALSKLESPRPDWSVAVIQNTWLPGGIVADQETQAQWVKHARETQDASMLSALAQHDVVTEPVAEDVTLLLSDEGNLIDYQSGGFGLDNRLLIPVLWSELADPDAMRKLLDENTIQGVAAAAVLAVGHQDADAIKLLTDRVVSPPSARELEMPVSVQRRLLALDTLVLLRKGDILPKLIEQAKTIDIDQWSAARYRQRLINAVAILNTSDAVGLIELANSDQRYGGYYSGENNIDLATAAMLMLDQTFTSEEVSDGGATDQSTTAKVGPNVTQPSQLLTMLRAETKTEPNAQRQGDALLPPWPDDLFKVVTPDEWHSEMTYYDHQNGSRPTVTPPASHYLDTRYAWWIDEDELEVEALRNTAFDSETSTYQRVNSLRSLATLGDQDIVPDLFKLLDDSESLDPQLRLDVVWALAWLKGAEALPTIREAYAKAEGFDERVELAGLLHLLGDERGSALLDRASELLTIRRLRARTFSITDRPKRQGGGLLGLMFGGSPNQEEYAALSRNLSTADATPNRALVPWWSIVGVTRGPSVVVTEDRLMLDRWAMPTPEQRTDWSNRELAEPASIRLTLSGGIEALTTPIHQIPVPALMNHSASAFGQPLVSESYSEPYVFVQLAHRSDTPLQLRDAWRTWWTEHRDAGWQAWWWQGVVTAEEELTHEKWWHRARGVARLRRLTGKSWPVPPMFDADAWAALQSDVRQWRESQHQADPVQVVLGFATESGVEFPETPESGDASLAQLVHLADAENANQSIAARLILNHWPEKPALVQAARAWQLSENQDLRSWIRDQLAAQTNQTKIYYGEVTQPSSD